MLDYLNPDEADALASFLVEVLGLEEAIRSALSTYYAAPEHREDFEKVFLDRLTLGTAVGWRAMTSAHTTFGRMVSLSACRGHRAPHRGSDQDSSNDLDL